MDLIWTQAFILCVCLSGVNSKLVWCEEGRGLSKSRWKSDKKSIINFGLAFCTKMDPLADLRRNAYKARSHFKPEEVRRRRETVQVELRKQKKEESLAKRRNFTTQSLPADSDDEIETEVSDSQVKPEIIWLSTRFTTENISLFQLSQLLPVLTQNIMSDEVETQLNATAQFRKLLSRERDPPIEQVIACGVVPRFVQLLASPNPMLQVPSAM